VHNPGRGSSSAPCPCATGRRPLPHTWWRTLIDQKNRVYYFDSALSPQMVWLNLNQIDLGPGSGVRAIKIEGNDTLQGNVTRQLQPAPAIRFLAPKGAPG
jgi:penicillin V acylase-like amidase (Ntn superfamily)